jgi:hypothetical protein
VLLPDPINVVLSTSIHLINLWDQKPFLPSSFSTTDAELVNTADNSISLSFQDVTIDSLEINAFVILREDYGSLIVKSVFSWVCAEIWCRLGRYIEEDNLLPIF